MRKSIFTSRSNEPKTHHIAHYSDMLLTVWYLFGNNVTCPRSKHCTEPLSWRTTLLPAGRKIYKDLPEKKYDDDLFTNVTHVQRLTRLVVSTYV